MTKIDTLLASLTDTITEQHDQLVTITKSTDSLKKYTQKIFVYKRKNLLNFNVKSIKNLSF